MRYAGIIVAIIMISGCAGNAPPSFISKSNATQEQFMKDRYACYQETKSFSSSTYVGAYGGGSSSDVAPKCDAFSACLAAKGYYEATENNSTGTLLKVPTGTGIRCN